MEEALDRYILEHISKEDDYLYQLYRATNIHLLYGRMASGHLQGQLLKMLVELIRPKNIVEIGTFTGYSAICLAKGLKECTMQNGECRIQKPLVTFEINDEMEDFTRKWIEGSDVADLIDFRIGDALEEIPKMGVKFDMAFVDGDKRKYPEYYEMLMNTMNEGGVIIADNTLWDGHVLEEVNGQQSTVNGTQIRHKDMQTVGVKKFNDMVAADDRVEKIILPLRDGLTIIKIKKLKD